MEWLVVFQRSVIKSGYLAVSVQRKAIMEVENSLYPEFEFTVNKSQGKRERRDINVVSTRPEVP